LSFLKPIEANLDDTVPQPLQPGLRFRSIMDRTYPVPENQN